LTFSCFDWCSQSFGLLRRNRSAETGGIDKGQLAKRNIGENPIGIKNPNAAPELKININR